MPSFVADYAKFVHEYEGGQYHLDMNTSSSYDIKSRREASFSELKDPITGEKIKIPVVTRNGNIFDEDTLLRQFDKTKYNNFNFVHPNNKKEEVIEYLDWKRVTDLQEIIEKDSILDKNNSRSSTMTDKNDSLEKLLIEKEQLINEMNLLEAKLNDKKMEFKILERKIMNAETVPIAHRTQNNQQIVRNNESKPSIFNKNQAHTKDEVMVVNNFSTNKVSSVNSTRYLPPAPIKKGMSSRLSESINSPKKQIFEPKKISHLSVGGHYKKPPFHKSKQILMRMMRKTPMVSYAENN